MATPASAPLVLPFDLASMPMDKRRAYLRVLWNAGISIRSYSLAWRTALAMSWAVAGIAKPACPYSRQP